MREVVSDAVVSDAAATELVLFWQAAGPQRWFSKDAAFDAVFAERFRAVHFAAARQELAHWLGEAVSALALLLALDQYPRNSFRGTAHMFATDYLALHWARRAVDEGHDQRVAPALRSFFYLPFMHSETLADQQRCVALCEPLGGQTLHHAREHRDIIARFGRFPHRNAVLLRTSSAQEQAYLDAGGFAG
ncbi:hypothetical protein AAV94_01875 [Lampropedia cohaerens]|uniref:SpoVR like family protein n=1 Tax=Lampropedia cohaerens TaxID=1610491 RepID=A0A0U1Q387_9BURK|nr:DUF924 family protein [Lampropedia cohaerens]KKW69222.1 hypothetical protein AAV94_01875 [Lampropedia cohaerens]